MTTKRIATVLIMFTGFAACASSDSSVDDDELVFDDDGKSDRASQITSFGCDVDAGLEDTDAVAALEFMIKGFNTTAAEFVEGKWTVLDRDGKALEPDGDNSSVVAASFETGGNDVEQCRTSGSQTRCGTFKILTGDISSEYGVSLYLTARSRYRTGKLTIDRTISVGDYLTADIHCTVNGH